MRQLFQMALLLLMLLAMVGSGCGPAGSKRLPVSGQVIFKGEPLARGSIQFFTKDGPAGGAMIEAGAYQLPAEHGLDPGTYRVWISATEPIPNAPSDGMSPPTRELIPEEFNSMGSKTVDVTAVGPNQFNFDIPNEAPKKTTPPK